MEKKKNERTLRLQPRHRANLHIAIYRDFGYLVGERSKLCGPMDAGRFRL